MKKFFKNNKVQNILSWIGGIGMVLLIPYLFVGILSAGLSFKPLGYLIMGSIYYVVGASIIASLIDIYKRLNRRYKRIYLENGRSGINKELRSYIKPVLILGIFVIALFGLMPKSIESFIGYLIILSFFAGVILSSSQGINKLIKKIKKKKEG